MQLAASNTLFSVSTHNQKIVLLIPLAGHLNTYDVKYEYEYHVKMLILRYNKL